MDQRYTLLPNDSVIIKLIGNKCDKPKIIEKSEIKELCDKYNIDFNSYLEVSAEKNINIDRLFDDIVNELEYKLTNLLIIPDKKNGISVINEMDYDLSNIPKKKK